MRFLSWDELYDCLRHRPDDPLARSSLRRSVCGMARTLDNLDLSAHALEAIVALHRSSRADMQPVHSPLTGQAVTLDLRFR